MNLYTDISEWVTFVVYSLFGCATHESPVTHHRVWGGVFTVAVCSISAGDRIRCKRHFTRPSKMPVLFFCCLISPQKMWPFQIRFVK